MSRLLIVIVLIIAGIVGMCFYMGWFHIESDSSDGTTHINLTVEQKKIQEYEKDVVKKVQGTK